jgi:(p)ppGpp synthase/HD superfamily hydrolase
MTLLEQAIELATRAHAGQIDEDGLPHIIHCLEVMSKSKELYGWFPGLPFSLEELMIAAVLHDTVEDSPNVVTLAYISMTFGKNVADMVDSVTRRGLDQEEKEKESYRDFIYRAKAHAGGKIIKIADLNHNLGRTKFISEKKAAWRKKLECKYDVSLRVLTSPDAPTWEQASLRSQYEDKGNLRAGKFYIADPNGKEIEITEEEYNKFAAVSA